MNPEEDHARKMETILVVDDEPLNREVIQALLDGEGYTLIEAASGAEALAIAAVTPPDLVLLDVMMSGLNGFETTKRLKDGASDQYLPIILVTALSDQASRVTGLRAQADEFLTKPIDRQELRVRVRNLLDLRREKAALLRKNTEHVELHRFKDELSSMIIHDLKNPLSAVIGNLDYVLESPGQLDKTEREALEDAKEASTRALRLIQNLLDVARSESHRLTLERTPTPIAPLVDTLIQQRAAVARSRGIALSSTLSPLLEIAIDRELILRVIDNILDNAFRYAPAGGRIEVFGEVVGEHAEIRIGNTGPAIPAEVRSLIFEKFGQTPGSGTGRHNLGLGLYFCRLAVEAHGGRIWVEESASLPSIFALQLPLAASSQQAAT